MKRGFSAAILAVLFGITPMFLSCGSVPTNTYTTDLDAIMSKYYEVIDADELPESSFLSSGESVRLFDMTVSNGTELGKIMNQISAQNFYRCVGYLIETNKDIVSTSFGADAAMLARNMRFGMVIYGKTNETSTYHNGYWIGTSYVQGWTEYIYVYTAYFLVPIPRTDRDAWMLGFNVKDMSYDDRSRLSRNTGVLISNVYDNTPAFSANLRPDYVITGVNGKTINTLADWERETQSLKAGDQVKLTTAHYGHGDYFTETVVARAIPPEEEKNSEPKEKPQIGTKDDFVYLKAGTFQMGNKSGEADAKPVHEVEINSFYMCNHEVTQEEYFSIMGTNPSYFVGDKFDMKYQPVERVRWEDAIRYCNKRSEAEGLQKCYSMENNGGGWTCNWKANGYRLPTEAEWEYAARGGDRGKDKKFAGGTSVEEVAWYFGNSGIPQEIMQKTPNALGLYDLSGNVWEWCWDKYNDKYYSESPKANPKGASSSSESSAYVLRGGSAFNDEEKLTVYKRLYTKKSEYDMAVGFRVVRTKMD